jgi:hypothetical protein
MSHADDVVGTAQADALSLLRRTWWRRLGSHDRAALPSAQPPSDSRRIALFARVVILGMALALGFTFVLTHYFQMSHPFNTFLVSVDNCFMDFFNVNYYSYGLDPYPTGTVYPPFGLLVARAFAMGFDYSAHGALAARASRAGQLSALILAVGFCICFFTVVYRAIRTGDRGRDFRLTLVLCASYPVLFLLDRGNYLMISFPFLFGFVHYYERNRRLANLFLALAISTKLYPLLFLLLLAADRRWRDCAAVVGLTAALNLGALAFFKGGILTNTWLCLHNVLAFSKGFADPVVDAAWNLSFSNLIRVPYLVFFHAGPPNLPRYYSLFALLVIGLLFYALRTERVFWKRVLIVTIAQVGVPTYMADYNLVYLVIPLLLYFRDGGELRKEDYLYAICAGLLFVPKDYYILEVHGAHQVLTPQAFINPLLLLVLFLGVVVPRSASFVLGGGAALGLAAVGFCVTTRLAHSNIPHPAAFRDCGPWLGMNGHAGPWLLRKGFTLTGGAEILRQRPVIYLRGPNYEIARLGGKLPGVQARLVIAGRPSHTVPATLVPEGGEYVLTIKVDPGSLPEFGPVQVRLAFDSWFVPKQLGLGDDYRELVIPTPHTLTLLPAEGGPRAGLGMKGDDGGWILRDGFTVTAPVDLLRHRPVIRLHGPNLSMDRLGGKLPGVKASVVVPARPPTPTTSTLVAEKGDYVLTVTLDPRTLPREGGVEVHLTFDSWFVPKQLGLGEDPRQLVLPTPHSLRLLQLQEVQAQTAGG